MVTKSQTIIRVEIPVPIPLKFVNCYLCKSSNGWVIIDTGMDTVKARQAWLDVFENNRIDYRKGIHKILITHYHPDHIGLAGWLEHLTGADVLISAEGKIAAQNVWSNYRQNSKRVSKFFLTHGMPPNEVDDIETHMNDFMKYISPLPHFTTIDVGEEIEITEGNKYSALNTPGHCDGHFVFYEKMSGILIGGDQILDKISPNISLWPDFDPNPLQSFIDSLIALKKLRIELVYPGHGPILTSAEPRIDQLLKHHEERLTEIVSYVILGYQNAYAICRKLFENRQLDLHQLRFAIAETLAHLVFLEEQGRLQRTEAMFNATGSIIVWNLT